MKQREFRYEKIEICRNCKGFGYTEKDNKRNTCPICLGKGHIKKTIEGIVTIESVRNDNSN